MLIDGWVQQIGLTLGSLDTWDSAVPVFLRSFADKIDAAQKARASLPIEKDDA